MIDPPPTQLPLELRINEVVADNEGVWLDEQGEADDYVELFNPTSAPLDLSAYLLFDGSGGYPLPSRVLQPGEALLVWADDSPEQGPLHLPFKVSAGGERLRLISADARLVDEVSVPALAPHHAYVRLPDGRGKFVDCGWASPARKNGAECGPPHATEAPRLDDFAPYAWPSPWPATPTPLRLSEARLLPADFVEVENTSDQVVELGDFALRVAPMNPRVPYPTFELGEALAWPQATLAPGEIIAVSVAEAALADVRASANFEGALTLFDAGSGDAIDRLVFSDWPEGATLARDTSTPAAAFRYCNQATPGRQNDACDPLQSRPVGRYLHALHTPGDFHALSFAHAGLGEESLGFMVNMEQGGTVTFLNSKDFPTHYNYVREELLQQGPVDICTPEGRTAYQVAWASFVRKNMLASEGRLFEVGSLFKHAGTELSTVLIVDVNLIPPERLKRVFFSLMEQTPDPQNWAVRPMSPAQAQRFSAVEGELPLVATDAPYRGVSYQPLVPGVTFGTLRWASAEDLPSLQLGPRDIVLTDSLPNDIPLIAGLITEAFQTPLSHVNVLSRARGTPNMALRDAHLHPRVAPLLGKLVRLEVAGFDFQLSLADPAEALAYWEMKQPSEAALVPRLDTDVRGVVPLEGRSLADLPAVGGKASQLAELGRVELCEGASIPAQAFAIPLVHSLEHYEASGANALLAELRKNPAFSADEAVRAEGLARVRARVMATPVDPALLREVVSAISERWPPGRVRFRSSSNVEDLAGFNGAGLYASEGVDVDAASAPSVEQAVLGVWQSLWNDRAFAEREYYHVDQSRVAMAVLVHPGFPSERANGVVVSRNVLSPEAEGQIYVNAQVGEALVTNPAPGISSDELAYVLDSAEETYFRHSTFSPDAPVLSAAEAAQLACSVVRIHDHFEPLLDPQQSNPWFAMNMEFKLMGPERSLVIKQARPYSFGQEMPAGWCPL
ncbi:MAG: PEP/pyruvate-binding domain-containing protein [Polyangiaceae bacterium]